MSELIYMDNGSTTFPKPDEVYDYMDSFYRNHGVNPGRSGYDMCLVSEEVVQITRKMLTDFFNGTDPNRLTFSYNASDSLNILLSGLIEKGDHVITTNLEHNSVLRPLYHRAHDGDIDVSYIPFDNEGYVVPDDIKKAFRKNTKLMVINHASNVLGTVQPLAEIGKYCREAGILFVIDTSQSAGVVKIDVQAMNIDAVAFTGHKCMMGPTGIGGSYIREGVDVKITRSGGTGVRSAYPFHLDEYPYRLEVGTLNLVGVAGLNAGLKWVLKEGVENIHKREMALWEKLRKGLEGIEGVTTYCAGSKRDRIAVLSFNLKGWEALDVGTMLDVDHNIACRTGLQCAPLVHRQIGTEEMHGTVRFGIGPFNTEEHIDKAIQAVREIASIRK
ncbi:MAG: aminotransferase class V-fold PLP-dependent enzyme [Bacteroidetes bacterium]|nr:aminotransferase class V-fold PLP-dependent enzyme [Bacteroidota bacterium]